MKSRILVVTATPGFGELVRQTLHDTGLYQVELLDRAGEALGYAQEKQYALAILDNDLEDIPIFNLVPALRKAMPGVPLVVIPPNNDSQHPSISGLDVQGFLNKPFYLPELQALVDRLLLRPPTPAAPSASAASAVTIPRPVSTVVKANQPPAWLQDVSRAAQHLTGLSLESSAQAALIVKDGSLWAYAGQLSQPAAQELAVTAANYWAQEREMPPGAHREGSKSDLARFMRLGATGGEYMVYATSLGTGMILALAFDAETPFSKIRSQASHLARALASPPETVQQLPPTSPQARSVDRLRTVADKDARNKPIQNLPVSGSAALVHPPRLRQSPNDIPELTENWLKFESLEQDSSNAEADEVETDLAADKQARPAQPANQDLHRSGAQIVMDPVMPGMVHLVYACVIIPRLPQHHLSGDLAEKLIEWVGQLCLAFAWRLEQISLSPEYLQWVVNVSPTTSPSYLMRILRQHTSQRIFAEFPDLARTNPSGDFWAPGYLIMSSPQLPPEQIVRDFIQQIRQHQGASNPFLPRFQR